MWIYVPFSPDRTRNNVAIYRPRKFCYVPVTTAGPLVIHTGDPLSFSPPCGACVVIPMAGSPDTKYMTIYTRASISLISPLLFVMASSPRRPRSRCFYRSAETRPRPRPDLVNRANVRSPAGIKPAKLPLFMSVAADVDCFIRVLIAGRAFAKRANASRNRNLTTTSVTTVKELLLKYCVRNCTRKSLCYR